MRQVEGGVMAGTDVIMSQCHDVSDSPVEDVVGVAGLVGDGADHGAHQLHLAGLAGADLVLLHEVPVLALNIELGRC